MAREAGVSGGANRRHFLQTALAGAVVGISARSGIRIPTAPHPRAPTRSSPDGALEQLLAGNQRFVTNQLTSRHHDLANLRQHTVESQEPFAGVLSCADSRVPVELVFDQSIGQIFVTRVAGNFVTPEIIASLEYGVAVLNLRAILVMGHTNCGALKAAMKTETVPGQISSLYAPLQAAVEQASGSLDKAIAGNARLQAELLRTSSTVIRQALAAGTLKVAAAVYDLGNGKVTVV